MCIFSSLFCWIKRDSKNPSVKSSYKNRLKKKVSKNKFLLVQKQVLSLMQKQYEGFKEPLSEQVVQKQARNRPYKKVNWNNFVVCNETVSINFITTFFITNISKVFSHFLNYEDMWNKKITCEICIYIFFYYYFLKIIITFFITYEMFVIKKFVVKLMEIVSLHKQSYFNWLWIVFYIHCFDKVKPPCLVIKKEVNYC